MNIEFYSDSFLRHQIANVHCGTASNVVVNLEPLKTNIYDMPNPPTGTEPIGVVSSSGNVTVSLVNTNYLDGATPFDIGEPDVLTGTPHDYDAPTHYIYTIGGTKLWYKWYRSTSTSYQNYRYFAMGRADVRSGAASGYTTCNIRYGNYDTIGWCASNSRNDSPIDFDVTTREFVGLYFVQANVIYNDESYDVLIPLFVLQPIGNTNPINWTILNTCRFYTSNIIEGFYELPDYEPTNNNVRRGGRGDGSYGGTRPEEMDVETRNTYYSFGNHTGNGLAFYEISLNAYAKFLNDSYSLNFWVNPQRVMSCMVSCFMLPVSYVGNKSANIQKVYCASSSFDVDESYIIYDRFMSGEFTPVSLGQSGYDDYNDFVNTSASLLLPFVGRVDIDINAIARGELDVRWIIDVYTGNITYWIYTRGMDTEYAVLYACVTGNCAVQMPLSGYNRWNQSGLGMLVGVAAPAVTSYINSDFGNDTRGIFTPMHNPLQDAVAGGIGGLANVATSQVQNMGHVSRAMNFNTNISILGAYECRLDIERLEVVRVEDYRDIAGIPAFNTQKVSSLSGFVKVHSAKWETLSCAQDEKEQIAELFANGVYM